jgi:hypothetical protein
LAFPLKSDPPLKEDSEWPGKAINPRRSSPSCGKLRF